jgi:hypothetical protein
VILLSLITLSGKISKTLFQREQLLIVVDSFICFQTAELDAESSGDAIKTDTTEATHYTEGEEK